MSTTAPLVPIEELAKRFSISVSTARTWVRQGLIPKDTYIKAGSTYRFDIAKVIAALTAKTTDDTAPEIAHGPMGATKPEAEEAPFTFNNPDEDA